MSKVSVGLWPVELRCFEMSSLIENETRARLASSRAKGFGWGADRDLLV